MKIQPTQTTQTTPNFGLNVTRKIRFDNETKKRVIDTVHLENGKKLIITKGYDCNTLCYKLQYLKDKAGDWVKSKLRYYSGGKVYRKMESVRSD